jgi:raffinose/stachyose/melibiose transport system permease protein
MSASELSSNLKPRRVLGEISMLLVALIVLFPLYLIMITAVKSPNDIAMSPFGWPKGFVFNNFVQAWQSGHFDWGFRNSLFIAVISITFIVFIGALAAYPLARKPSRVNNLIYILFISLIMVPFQMAMIPLYKLIKGLEWINTYRAVICINIATSMPLVIFLYTGFMKSIPKELEESAIIDGCNELMIFWRIVFPLLKPATATVIILNTLQIWNDFLMPMLFLQKAEYRTIPVALFAFQGQYNNNWSLLFAAMALAMIPMLIMFLILQRDFIKGITAGSVKG